MRIDRIFAEGEAKVSLRQLGFDVRESEGRPNLYDVSHPKLGGARTFTVEQLTVFAEGATLAEQLITGVVPGEPSL